MDEGLLKGAERIENSHIRFSMAGEDGKRCLVGAVAETCLSEQTVSAFRELVYRFTYDQAIDYLADGLCAERRGDVHYGLAYIPAKERKLFLRRIRRVGKLIPETSDRCCQELSKSQSRNALGNKVAHYNDVHCTGGVEAAKILREAAEL